MAEEVKDIAEEAVVERPKGRAAIFELWKGSNPDVADDPDDDVLFDFAGGAFSERDGLKEKYDQLNGANERLASAVSEDPRFAQFIAMVAGGENPMFALGKTFGNMVDELDEKQLDELRKGQEDYKSRYNQIKENFSTYESDLKNYGEQNGLSEEELVRIDSAILDLAETFLDRSIPTEVIEIVHKGLSYDEDKAAEIEAAQLAGKNEAIEEIKAKKAPATLVPDIGGQKTNQRAAIKYEPPKVINAADAFVERTDV